MKQNLVKIRKPQPDFYYRIKFNRKAASLHVTRHFYSIYLLNQKFNSESSFLQGFAEVQPGRTPIAVRPL
jgi:hypothetical protein